MPFPSTTQQSISNVQSQYIYYENMLCITGTCVCRLCIPKAFVVSAARDFQMLIHVIELFKPVYVL